MDSSQKQAQGHGMPWETEYGYAQGLRVGDTVWLAGQIGHDEHGTIAEGMLAQMRQAYANVHQLLASFGLSMADVVDETLYVLDNEAAFAARQQLGREVYPDPMLVPSTMIGVACLNLPALLVEIKVVARQLPSTTS